MKTEWDNVFSEERFGTDLEPRPFVMKHMKSCPPEAGPVLDIGCGCGRHVIYLAGLGYDIYGVDTSSVALARTREHLSKFKLNAHLEEAPMWDIPFGDLTFSAVLCMSVINHGTEEQVAQTVQGITTRLNASGCLIVTSLTPNDYKATGRQVGPRTYICDEGPERGILHTLFNQSAIMDILMPYFRINDVTMTHYQHTGSEERPLHGEQLWIKATRK
jgi:2-polyprenyl-3-methyl-5-hydroxy-6-metoxy-1,4-benzoquinol methylase